MVFREFGRLDWQPSALGFGCMRLPTRSNEPFGADVIEDESIRIIRYGIDQGINYVDTAYGYHGGRSEVVLGKALQDGYRQRVKLAPKSPTWLMKQTTDFELRLNEQLKRLQTDRIDFYLFHGLGHSRWNDNVLRLNLLRRAEAAQQDGRIGHIGFSFHDNYEAFVEVVDGYDLWEFCQIQYNYLDTETQAGTKGLRYAAAKGLAVVAMEPLLGGKLARPPAEVRQIFDDCPGKRAPADWALQWVWNQPEVSLLLSGMSSLDQVEANLKSAQEARVDSFRSEDLRLIEQVQQQYKVLIPIPCTSCGYCMPCPSGVNIPTNLDAYNDALVHNAVEASRFVYERFIPEKARAGACTQCHECDEKCTQGIVVSEWMPKVHALLGRAKEG